MKDFQAGVLAKVCICFVFCGDSSAGWTEKPVQMRVFGDTHHKRLQPNPPFKDQEEALRDANKSVRKVAWINVLLQRFFYELAKSQKKKRKFHFDLQRLGSHSQAEY